jgi:hypothetical protein
VEVLFEVTTLDQAQAVADQMESVVFHAVGPNIVPDPELGGLSRTELEALDEDAQAALAADDLGPGITSVRFEYGRLDPGGS